MPTTDCGTDKQRRTQGVFRNAWVPLRLTTGIKLVSLVLYIAVTTLGGGFAFAQARPVVTIENGDVRGVVEGRTAAFRNLPFASPPTGSLRWRPPQPTRNWNGVREAASFGSPCPQPPFPPLSALKAPIDEDCLSLNVYTPPEREADERLPVLFYIHGGGLRNNSMENPGFDGHVFVEEHDIIVVTANYRLARHGFFGHPALSPDEGEPIGNYGFMDQIAALRWVRRNIAAFGGDPAKVTIMGVSGGAVSVLNLVASPHANGLFHAAIAMSGPSGRYRSRDTQLNGLPSMNRATLEFVRFFGLDNGPEGIAALRSVPWQSFYEPEALALAAKLGMTVPILDGDIVVAPVQEVIAKGRHAKVPMIIGVVGDEANIARKNAPEDLDGNSIRERFGPFYDGLRQHYSDLDDQSFGEALWSDVAMFVGVRKVASLHQEYAPTYVYRLNYTPTTLRDSFPALPHGIDGHLLFDAGRSGESHSRIAWSAEDESRAKEIRARWAAFAKTGDPNVSDMTHWPRFRPESLLSIEFGSQDQIKSNVHGDRIDHLELLLRRFCDGEIEISYLRTARLVPGCFAPMLTDKN